MLPKHNFLLRSLYVLLVLFMFAFMMLLVRAYWPQDDASESYYDQYSDAQYADGQYADAQENFSNQHQKHSTEQPLDHANAERVYPTQKTIHASYLHGVVGLSSTLYLNHDVQSQMEEIWSQLYGAKVYQMLEREVDRHRLFMVYKGWNAKQNSVELVFGYESQTFPLVGTGLERVEIPNKKYRAASTVLDAWNKDQGSLRYQMDYEVYEVDAYFDIQSLQAYVSVR